MVTIGVNNTSQNKLSSYTVYRKATSKTLGLQTQNTTSHNSKIDSLTLGWIKNMSLDEVKQILQLLKGMAAAKVVLISLHVLLGHAVKLGLGRFNRGLTLIGFRTTGACSLIWIMIWSLA